MPTATITPKFINDPKPGAKSGSIKDAEGNYWGVRPADLRLFERDRPVEVVYTEREYQGKVYKNIQELKSPYSTGQHPGPAPAVQQPKAQNGVGFRPPMDPKDGMEARISLICKAYAQAGIVPSAQDVAQLVTAVTEGVRMAFMRTTSPQRAPDLDESIPY